jgi:hypothetical protein
MKGLLKGSLLNGECGTIFAQLLPVAVELDECKQSAEVVTNMDISAGWITSTSSLMDIVKLSYSVVFERARWLFVVG